MLCCCSLLLSNTCVSLDKGSALDNAPVLRLTYTFRDYSFLRFLMSTKYIFFTLHAASRKNFR